MGFSGPRSVPDRFQHALSGAVPDRKANIVIEPTIYLPNPTWKDVDEDADPDGYQIGMPEDPEGIFIYLSEKDAGPATLAAQNTVPIDAEIPFAVLTEPWAGGHLPTTSGRAARIARPQAPTLQAISRSDTGFAAGLYYIAYSFYYRFQGISTETFISPASTVTVSSGQGIQFNMPQQWPEGVIALCLYLSAPNGGYDTLQFQEFVWKRVVVEETHLLAGPWVGGRLPPAKNQAIKVVPPEPVISKTQGGTESIPGIYLARITSVDSDGSISRPSAYSDAIEITEEDAANKVHAAIDFKDASGDQLYNVYITRDGVEYKYSSGDSRSAPTPVKAPTIVSKSISNSMQDTRCASTSAPQFTLVSSEKISVSGHTQGDAPNGSKGVLAPIAYIENTILGQTGVATWEDIQSPDTPLDGVVPQSAALLDSPGTYYVAISYWVRDRESLVSEAVPITLSTNQTIRVIFPDSVNLVKNAQLYMLKPNGQPLDWTLTGIGGAGASQGSFSTDTGTLILTSNGARTSTQLSPQASNTFDIDRTQTHTFGGTYSAQITSGNVQMILEELDGAGSLLGSVRILKSISGSGEIDVESVWEPTDFNPLVASIRQSIRMTPTAGDGALTRNAVVRLDELFALVHNRKIRRREFPPQGSREHTNPDVPPSTRHLKLAQKGVELPPARQYQSLDLGAIERVDFEGNALPSTWTLRQSSVLGNVAQVDTGSAITGTYGYQLSKSTSAGVFSYIYRSVSPADRTQLSLRAQFRIDQLPTKDEISLLILEDTQADSLNYPNPNAPAYLSIDKSGTVRLWGYAVIGGFYSYTVLTGVFPGDVIDLELSITGAGTRQGIIQVRYSRNGRPMSSMLPNTGWNWTGIYPNVAIVGPAELGNAANKYDLAIDNIVISELGGTASSSLVIGPPPGEAIAKLDRPYKDAVVLQDVNFDSGIIPSPWTTTATTLAVVDVGASYAIEGAQGIRTVDSNTSTAGEASISYLYPVATDAGGLRARYRVNARPTSGNSRIMEIRDATSALAYVYLNSTGELWLQAVPKVGSSPAARMLANGLTNTTIFTLALDWSGAGTQSGALSAWATIGTEADKSVRELRGQLSAINWTGGTVSLVKVGTFNESVATITPSYDIDSVLLTERGEIVYQDLTSANENRYQSYAFYPVGQPVRDDLWLRTVEPVIVKPLETYTAAIEARHANLQNTAYPYFFTAIALDGTEYPLGSLYGVDEDGNEIGATGTMEWTRLERTFVIPADCYEIKMDSKQIGGGEFVAQDPAFSRGDEAFEELFVTATAMVRGVTDTYTPNKTTDRAAWTNEWLALKAIINTPEGTSAAIKYGSAWPDASGFKPSVPDITVDSPDGWYTDPTLVPQKRYFYFHVDLTSDPEHRISPWIEGGSPFVEFGCFFNGMQFPVLLRGDGSEFPGGVYLDRVVEPISRSEWDFFKPRGMTFRHRRYAPVDELPEFTLTAHTREAAREIQEISACAEFMIESAHKRMKVIFGEEIVFTADDGQQMGVTPTPQGVWLLRSSASVSGAQVLEYGQMTGLP